MSITIFYYKGPSKIVSCSPSTVRSGLFCFGDLQADVLKRSRSGKRDCKTFSIWRSPLLSNCNRGSFLGENGYGGAPSDTSLAAARESGFALRTHPSHSQPESRRNPSLLSLGGVRTYPSHPSHSGSHVIRGTPQNHCVSGCDRCEPSHPRAGFSIPAASAGSGAPAGRSRAARCRSDDGYDWPSNTP